MGNLNRKLYPLSQPLNYFTVNQILAAKHPNLSGYWTSMGFNDDKSESYIMYEMEDGSEENVTVDQQGNVTASEKVMAEMNEIG